MTLPTPVARNRVPPTDSGTGTYPACATRRPSSRMPKCSSVGRHTRPDPLTSKGSWTSPLISSNSLAVYRASRVTAGGPFIAFQFIPA